MDLEWDPDKARRNQRKHGLSFGEAGELFRSGTNYLEIYDIEHSEDEDRFIAIGPVRRGVICVVFVERETDTVRIVSARFATRRERQLLAEYLGDQIP